MTKRSHILHYILAFLFIAQAYFARSQSPILAISTGYVSSSSTVSSYTATPASGSGSYTSCSSNTFNYNFDSSSSNELKLYNFTANSKTFFITQDSTSIIKLRRVNNANVTGNRSIVSLEAASVINGFCSGSTNINLKSPYQDSMETFFNTNILNQASDNIFTNSSNGDGNVNNIERVDVIFPKGIYSTSATDAGFAIFDRGNINSHDGFRIAAITSVDASGNPLVYGSIKSCIAGNGSNNGSWGHPTAANGNITFNMYVLRKDQSETRLRVSATISQQLGGVFFSFSDLGISANQTIYGYSLFATDGVSNPTSAQLLNLNDTTVYPRNTLEANGGLDLMALNGIFSTGGTILALKEAILNGTENSGVVKLNCTLKNIGSGSVVTIEYSPDGNHFSPIHSFAATGGDISESWNTPAREGINWYRLKIQPLTAPSFYSNIVETGHIAQTSLRLYPTILSSGAKLHIEGLADGAYTAQFTFMDGRVEYQAVTVHSAMTSLTVPGSGRGLCVVTFRGVNSTYSGYRLVIQ